MGGIDNAEIEFSVKITKIVPKGQVYVMRKKDTGKFLVCAQRKLTNMEIVTAINHWFESKEKKELANNSK
jgi:hypothetical protein